MKLSWCAAACVLALVSFGCSQPSATSNGTKESDVKETPSEPKPPETTATPPKSQDGMPMVALEPAKSVGIDAAGLVAVLEAPKGPVAAPYKLTFVLENPGDQPRTFCDYHSPFEGVRNNIFEVTDASGKALDYQGKMAKRVAPTLANHWTVPPKSRVKVDFMLESAYALSSGTYKIRFAGNAISGLPASAPVEVTIAP